MNEIPVNICSVDGCREPAVAAYTWDWGEHGVCCAMHQFLLRQRADSLGRTVTFSPLVVGTSLPLERTERVRLNAEILVLRQELQEAKDRGLALYTQLSGVQSQLATLHVQRQELEAQLSDVKRELSDMTALYETAHSELAVQVDEVQRLRSFIRDPAATDGDSGFGP